MLEEVVNLTPNASDGPDEDIICDLAPSDPPIMIPGINADGSLYPVEKIKAHTDGLHHLALSVFVFDGDKLLIQRRALDKYHCGGQWANTCCTHPHMYEDIEEAATRRLQEELGFSVPVEKKLVVEYSANVGGGLWEHERVHMFHAEADSNTLKLDLNPDEVCETRWINAEDLRADMAKNPNLYTPWFRIYLNRFPKLDF